MSSLRRVDKNSNGITLIFKGKEKEPKEIFVPNEIVEEILSAFRSLSESTEFTSRQTSVLRQSFLKRGESGNVERKGRERESVKLGKSGVSSSVDRAIVVGYDSSLFNTISVYSCISLFWD